MGGDEVESWAPASTSSLPSTRARSPFIPNWDMGQQLLNSYNSLITITVIK